MYELIVLFIKLGYVLSIARETESHTCNCEDREEQLIVYLYIMRL